MSDNHDRTKCDVALSFAGEDRAIVEELAGELRSRGISVFYDGFAQADLWGKDLYEYLSELYSNGCTYCVMFVSHAYAQKDWTRLERRSAQSRSLRQDVEFLLPVRLDDTQLPGLLSTVVCMDFRQQGILGIADLLCEKLRCRGTDQMRSGDDESLVIELRCTPSTSKEAFGRQKMKDLQDSVLELAGLSEARLVGCEWAPCRLQIQANQAAYSRLRTKFMSGELDTITAVRWTGIAALEGRERAPAPIQTPLASLGGGSIRDAKQVVCHGAYIFGFDREAKEAERHLGLGTTTDMRRLRAFVTARGDLLYVHSTFMKPACLFQTKIATNLPIDLFTFFVNLVFLELPSKSLMGEARTAHTKHAEYLVKVSKIGRRGDEFFAGATNITFV